MSDYRAPLSGACTDIGRVRKHNEDSLVVHPPLYAVADGMGGHEAGEVASEIAIETLVANAPSHPDTRALGRAVRAANKAVLKAVNDGLGKPGMGTTLTAAIIEENQVAIAQVGDSRAYLLHNGALQRITKDHSLVSNLVERGIITETEARYHPKRSVITRALGSDLDMVPDLYEFEASAGDRVLLCSDGLCGMIEDERIQQLLMENPEPQEAAEDLVRAANDAGGHDNITAIVVAIQGESDTSMKGWQVRKKVFAVGLWVLAVIAVVAAAYFGVRAYAHSSAYLAEDNGHVALYRGLPGSVGPLTFSWPVSGETTVSVDALSASQKQKLETGWPQDSVEDGQKTLEALKRQAGLNASPEGGTETEGDEAPADGGGL